MNSIASCPITLLQELQARLLAVTACRIAAVSDTVPAQPGSSPPAVNSSPMPKAEPGLFGGNKIHSQKWKAKPSGNTDAPWKNSSEVYVGKT